MSVRREAVYFDLGAAPLLAQSATENECEADHSIVPMNAGAPKKLPLREIPAVAAGAFQQQHMVVRHVLHPKLVQRRRHDLLFLFPFCSTVHFGSMEVKTMQEPANDFRPPDDLDDAERIDIDAKAAPVRADSLKYQGRPDLLEIAYGVSLELGRLNRALTVAHREKRPKAERQALLDRELVKAREFAAIQEAMSEEERVRFSAIDLSTMATTE
jgi:hypothetical protein